MCVFPHAVFQRITELILLVVIVKQMLNASHNNATKTHVYQIALAIRVLAMSAYVQVQVNVSLNFVTQTPILACLHA